MGIYFVEEVWGEEKIGRGSRGYFRLGKERLVGKFIVGVI